jgi:hypothetical protein
LRAKAYEVAAVFQKERFATKRELNSLSQVAADATKIFPPDFLSVDPVKIQAKVSYLRRCDLVRCPLDLIAPWYCWLLLVCFRVYGCETQPELVASNEI